MRTEFASSCSVSIFMAGNIELARLACRKHCDEVGLCVTVTPTTYVYTGGEEHGVVIGLINYPRFPSQQARIEDQAIRLGMRLREALGQESFSVQTPTTTTWFSWRESDRDSDGTAIAAANGDLPVPQDCQARAGTASSK